MKKYLTAVLIFFSTNSLFAQLKFTLIGKITDAPKEIILSFEKKDLNIPVLSDGRFSFSGELKNPCEATIFFGNDIYERVFLDSGEIRLTIEKTHGVEGNSESNAFKITSVKGPETSESNFNINKIKLDLYKKFESLNQVEKADSLKKYLYPLLDHFVTKHPKSILSISLIATSGFDYKTKEILFNKLDKSYNREEVESLSKRIEREKKLAPGKKIDDFSMQRHDGEIFNLSESGSKYVLLEFWASWCAPCRAMRPDLSQLYTKYHKVGLEIVGISLDENKTNWLKAIEKDNVPWIEVSDLKGFKNSLAVKYDINAVPFWILIDKNRKIIETGFWSVSESTLKKLMP